jgi:hypothetical protein
MKLVKIIKHNFVQIRSFGPISFECAASPMESSTMTPSNLDTSFTFYSTAKLKKPSSIKKRVNHAKNKHVRFNLDGSISILNVSSSSVNATKDAVRNILETSKIINHSNKKKFKKSNTKRKSASIIVVSWKCY